MKVKCILIDDEPLALKVLQNHISKIPWLQIVGSIENPIEAFEILKSKKIDLVFLDIQMPELSGLEFLQTLANPPAVIFTTAYRQFAADSYDLDGLDYLIKPIAFPRFLKAVNKYVERYGNKSDLPLEGTATSVEGRSFFIKKGREMVKIDLDKILFIEGLKDYVQIFLKDQKYIYKARLSNLEEELLDDQFIRVHKSFLVPISKIQSISATEIKIGNQVIPVGRTYKNLVFKRLQVK